MLISLADIPFFQWMDLLRLLAACAAGGAIGLEREVHDKPAGFRTNILICLGAAIFTLLSIRIAEIDNGAASPTSVNHWDRGRIAAQIVTGVGFLGAGAIFRARGAVIGLTTAATIWAVASVGMAFGAGEFTIGIASTVLIGAILFLLGHLEPLITKWFMTVHLEVDTDSSPNVADRLDHFVRRSSLRSKTVTLAKTAEETTFLLVVRGNEDNVEKFEDTIVREQYVRRVRRA